MSNVLKAAPDTKALPKLNVLDLRQNHIGRLEEDTFSYNSNLTFLSFHDNELTSVSGRMLQWLTKMKYLDLGRNLLTDLPETLFTDLPSLQILDIGSNLLGDTFVFPPAPPNNSLVSLNCSHNPGLVSSLSDWTDIILIDVSGTAVPLSPSMCSNAETVVARQMERATGKEFETLVATCLHERVPILDVSDNSHLSADLGMLRRATANYEFELYASNRTTERKAGTVFRLNSFRDSYSAPSSCSFVREATLRRMPAFLTGQTSRGLIPYATMPSLYLRCACNPDFDEVDGVCQERGYWTSSRLLALVLGLLLALGVLALSVGRWTSRRRRKYQDDIELHQNLLQESRGELEVMKKAWEIDEHEVRLVRRIDEGSEGAFGEVWRGRWGTVDVAVKVLRRNIIQLDDTVVHEFQREVEFMQRTRHPRIVRFYGAGQRVDGTPFLVEELMERGSLQTMLRSNDHGKRRQLTLDDKVRMAHDVAQGMAHIHSLGHIHRDLKTGNVLVDGEGTAKVADFGSIGHILGSNRSPSTRTSLLASSHDLSGTQTVGVGTPLYMSPEALADRPYDGKTDIWSYGVVLWELLSEERPDLLEQEGHSGRGNLTAIVRELLQNGTRLHMQEAWPQQLRDIITSCWTLEPVDRPSFLDIGAVLSGHLLV